MDISEITRHARALYDAHGDKAEAEAAQKAADAKSSGKADEAENWTKIRGAIREIRGARAS